MSMYVCSDCVIFKVNGDYSGAYWSESRAENLKDYEILLEVEPHFVMERCSGCGEHGGDMYRARYYDELDTN